MINRKDKINGRLNRSNQTNNLQYAENFGNDNLFCPKLSKGKFLKIGDTINRISHIKVKDISFSPICTSFTNSKGARSGKI